MPEKDDVMLPETCNPPFRRHAAPGVDDLTASTLQCLWRGYFGEDCRCECRIPVHVVSAAWSRELEEGIAGEGFFHALWRGGPWLAYGHASGDVRGVYCPQHAADRDQRASAALSPVRASQPVA